MAIGLTFAAAFFGTAFAAGDSVNVSGNDPAMAAAFKRAAATLDDFLAKWRKRPEGTETFTVKVGLMDTSGQPGWAIVRPGATPPNYVEWFWVSNLREDGAGFAAELANDADNLDNVEQGTTVHFERADIGDWMYRKDGKIVGNFTACPALAQASPAERRQYAEMGINCD